MFFFVKNLCGDIECPDPMLTRLSILKYTNKIERVLQKNLHISWEKGHIHKALEENTQELRPQLLFQ
jgi:hypothetical protein